MSDAWKAKVRSAIEHTRAELDAAAHDPATHGSQADDGGGRIHPYLAARAVPNAVAAFGAVLIGDGAVCKHWLHDALRLPLGKGI